MDGSTQRLIIIVAALIYVVASSHLVAVLLKFIVPMAIISKIMVVIIDTIVHVCMRCVWQYICNIFTPHIKGSNCDT